MKPVVPLVLVGGALLFAATRTPKRSKKKGSGGGKVPPLEPLQGTLWLPPGSGKAGERCDGGPENIAAYDEQIHCKVYWHDGETDEVVRQHARDVWRERGEPSVAAICNPVQDPENFIEHQPSPDFMAIVSEALRRYYGRDEAFPPDATAPWWAQRVWDRAALLVGREFCGDFPGL